MRPPDDPAGPPARDGMHVRCAGMSRARATSVLKALSKLALVALGGVGCGGRPGAAGCCDALSAAATVDCGGSSCRAIVVSGHAPAATPGTFRGFADPSIARDPSAPGRVWLAYSWPHLVSGRAPNGSSVMMAAVSTHLARSDDGGSTFAHAGELWPAIPTTDPEGGGQHGIVSSETASLVAMASGGTVTWYGAHLRYFLEPRTGYFPKYATS